jgi:hypothetical protein
MRPVSKDDGKSALKTTAAQDVQGWLHDIFGLFLVAAVLAPVYLEADVHHLAAAPDAKVLFSFFLQRLSLTNALYLCR